MSGGLPDPSLPALTGAAAELDELDAVWEWWSELPHRLALPAAARALERRYQDARLRRDVALAQHLEHELLSDSAADGVRVARARALNLP